MLFAVQLWVDIRDDPEKKLEPHYRKLKHLVNVPRVSLCVFIVYFEHWLKAHELLRCTEYAHPFRVIDHMYEEDLHHDENTFSVSQHSINEGKVVEFVHRARSTESKWKPSTRVAIFPWHVIDTAMAPPVDMGEAGSPNPTLQALVGLPSIRVLGLPSLHRPKDHLRRLVIPSDLIPVTLFGTEFRWIPFRAKASSNVASEGTVSILAPFQAYGTIWKHEFLPARVGLVPHTSSNPREIRGGRLEHHLGLDSAQAFQVRSKIELEALVSKKRITFDTSDDLHVADDGLLCNCGKPDRKTCASLDIKGSVENCYGKFFAEDFLSVADGRMEWMKKLECFTASMIPKLMIGPDGLLQISEMPFEWDESLQGETE